MRGIVNRIKRRNKSSQHEFLKRSRPAIECLEPRIALATFTVMNTNNAGAGSLRQAILSANGTTAADMIAFAIPANDPGHVYYKNDGVAGEVSLANVATTTAANDADIADIDPDWPTSWYTIAPTSAFEITRPLVLDGATQAGSVANTNPVGQGLNSVLRVEINGSNAGEVSFGLFQFQSTAGGSTFRGLAINRVQGVKVSLDGATGTSVEGSFIGPDVSGTRAFPAPGPGQNVSDFHGLYCRFGTTYTIGGTTPAARNLISGNRGPGFVAGVQTSSASTGNLIQGNLIGSDRSGSKALGNFVGVYLSGDRTTVGGSAAGSANLISGNLDSGVRVSSRDSRVEGNRVGTNVAGSAALGNAGAGVLITINVSGTQVVGNTIAYNATGVNVDSGSGFGNGNRVSANAIFSNTGLGINLKGDDFALPGGVTPNDVPPASNPPDQDTGPNGLQNYPALGAVTTTATGIRIEGTLQSTPNTTFRLEFFANAERDASSNGLVAEGQTFLGAIDATTNAAGLATFAADVAAPPSGQPFLTATATSPSGDTSEFSFVAQAGGPSFVVTTTADTGAGTLRDAITNANLTSGKQTITFAIPANDPGHVYYKNDGIAGELTTANITRTTAASDTQIADIDPDWPHSWFTIKPASALPDVVDTITIDGYSQAGSSRNTLPALGALDTVLKIELDGSAVATGDGLRITANLDGTNITDAKQSRVEGLAINRWSGDGIELRTIDGQNVIAGNFIGTDVSGTIDRGNGGSGIFVHDEIGTILGGANPDARSLIAGNGLHGVFVVASQQLVLRGLVLGGNRPLTNALPNDGHAIFVSDTSDPTTIRAIASSSGARRDSGLSQIDKSIIHIPPYVPDEEAQSKLLQFIAIEEEKLTRFAWAIGFLHFIYTPKKPVQSSSSQIQSQASPDVVTLIDLGVSGVNPNDGDNPNTPAIDPDSDAGPNGLQNYPVLASAVTDTATTVKGSLTSTPNRTFRIEIYASSYDARVFRAGEDSLGTVDVTTDANGRANFTFLSPKVVPAGRFLTSLATEYQNGQYSGGTSEFSDGIPVVAAPSIIDARLVASARGVTAVVLEASSPLQAAGAGSPTNYTIRSAGADGRFGTRDDKTVALRSVAYNANAGTITLTPKSPIANNTLFLVTARASGLIGPTRAALDGNGDGQGGDDFRRGFARGTSLKYTEADGDKVSLSLAGGGSLTLTLDPTGQARTLRLDGTQAASTLTGSVTKARTGNGRARLTTLETQLGRRFRSTLQATAFRAGPLPKDAVDYLIAMSGGSLRSVLS